MNKIDSGIAKINQKYTRQILADYKPDTPVLKKVTAYINKYSSFIVTTHAGADPDGVGSEIAIYHLLKKMGKKAVIINNEKVPGNYQFMLENVKIFTVDEWDLATKNMDFKKTFVLLMDFSEMHRSEKFSALVKNNKLSYATIDHHNFKGSGFICNDTNYSATSELIWDLYHFLNIKITRPVALALYSGIIADTGNFRFSKTTFRTHLAAGELLSFHISSDFIYRKLFESAPPDKIIFLKRILAKTILNKEKGYVAGFIFKTMFNKLKLGDTPSDGIVNLLLAADGIKIAALMTETPEGFLKCSLRSVDDIDVSKLAGKFGGGGHKNASGLFIAKKFKDAQLILLKELEDFLT